MRKKVTIQPGLRIYCAKRPVFDSLKKELKYGNFYYKLVKN